MRGTTQDQDIRFQDTDIIKHHAPRGQGGASEHGQSDVGANNGSIRGKICAVAEDIDCVGVDIGSADKREFGDELAHKGLLADLLGAKKDDLEGVFEDLGLPELALCDDLADGLGDDVLAGALDLDLAGAGAAGRAAALDEAADADVAEIGVAARVERDVGLALEADDAEGVLVVVWLDLGSVWRGFVVLGVVVGVRGGAVGEK